MKLPPASVPNLRMISLQQLGRFAAPMFLFLACASICSFLLHVATHRHISRYVAKKSLFNEPLTPLPDLLQAGLANGMPFLVTIGDRMLDYFVLVPMFVFVLLMCAYRDLRVFTKTMLCCGLLSVGKGLCGVLTELPDARGDAHCAMRLRDPRFDVGAMDKLLALDFENSFWESVKTTFGFQLRSFLSMGGKGSVRYCSDMMYSGHTFFCAIVCYSVLQLLVKHRVISSQPLRLTVYALLLATPVIEALAVVATRFHYSVDVFVAIVLTTLVWSHPPIDRLAVWWSTEAVKRPGAGEAIQHLLLRRDSAA